jgi:diphthine-ammonia ligase
MRPRAAISWSGGKDCCLALLRAAETLDVVAMVTMFGEDGQRSRSHGLTPAVIAAQADRLGLPAYSASCSWTTYTDKYLELLAHLKPLGVTHMVFGDIMGDSHREWNERVCAPHGLTPVMPLWGQSTRELAEEFIDRGGEARLVTVRPPLLDAQWLGAALDHALVHQLVARGVDPCGEFGEYHTVVTNCPAFSAPLTLQPGRCVTSNGCHALDFVVHG